MDEAFKPFQQDLGMEQIRMALEEVSEYEREPVQHDQGFLERYEAVRRQEGTTTIYTHQGTGEIDPDKYREPTFGDHLAKLGWRTKLAGADLLRWDLDDATDRYDHFLDGSGETVDFDYGEYMHEDPAGQFLDQGMHEAMRERALHANQAPGAGCEPTHLQLQSQFSPRLYPETENWQKALGGHNLYMAGTAGVELTPEGVVVNTSADYRAEDMYNFNPNGEDLATGAPDSANGRFEQTRLAQQFLQVGTHESSQSRVVAPLLPPPGSTSTE